VISISSRFLAVEHPNGYSLSGSVRRRAYRELAEGLGAFAAIEKQTGQMARRFSLRPADSYGLTGGTELLIESAFERLRLDRVVATTMAGNTGSRRV
jgi:hypothetical protein